MSMSFSWPDWIPVLLYFGLLVVLTLRKKYRNAGADEVSFLLSGRTLTLPAFVATLVATWYGGILGVGEYTYQFGISQWLLFAFPFYVFAVIYALFLAGRIRKRQNVSIPEAMRQTYGEKAGYAGAAGVFILVSPAPYILMLGLIAQIMFGGEWWMVYAALVALFSAVYVGFGGFGSVVRTDVLQIVLMYAGFIFLLYFAWMHAGAPWQWWDSLPEVHRDFTGGHTFAYILVWFFIALWTFVDPGFHQRASAAESPRTARNGILISTGFWFVFDMLTLTAGLYAFIIIGTGLENPVTAYPQLAAEVLSPGFLGLFFTGMIAVIMSTLDSFLFLSGQTLGHDILKPALRRNDSIRLTRYGIFIAAGLGLMLIWLFPSVIELWYVIGSLVIPAMLIPVLGVYISFFRMEGSRVFAGVLCVFAVASFWMIMGIATTEALYSYAWLGVEPFYPGLLTAAGFLWYDKMMKRKAGASYPG